MEEKNDLPFSTKAATFGTTLVTAGVFDAVAHGGAYGLVIGTAVAGMAAYMSPEIYNGVKSFIPLSAIQSHSQREDQPGDKWTWKDRLLGRHLHGDAPEQQDEMSRAQPRRFDFDGDDELRAPQQKRTGAFLFSEVLRAFTPTLDRIYLGTLATGELVFCRAEDLCHVALAGATRAGKSSIMRMLMAQLCYAGASVLVLNPHHARYILDKKEDWTPFEPYLIHDPMECRKYAVIEHYLKQVATVLLPKRLDRFAVGQSVGKPYFLAMDELPDIVKHIPEASGYLDDILRQGAKVGIFLICASQDFLVKTLKLEGGAVRECYRSAFYVGGDATTAKVLLDMPANQINETALGKGTVMLRNGEVLKQAQLAFVPLVDNQALYVLLGTSTYQPGRAGQESGPLLEDMRPSVEAYPQTSTRYHSHATGRAAQGQRRAEREQRLRGMAANETSQPLSPELQRAYDAFEDGMSYRDLGAILGVGKDTAGKWYVRLKERGYISETGQRRV